MSDKEGVVEPIKEIEVVLTSHFGKIGLSTIAYERLIVLGMTVTRYNEDGNYVDDSADIARHIGECYGDYTFVRDERSKALRTDPRLIQVIKELGEKANGQMVRVKIVKIPDGIEWDIYQDGYECIREKHRKWC